MFKWIGASALLLLLVTGTVCGWVFLNPETPPLRTMPTAEMETIDGRSGVYREAGNDLRLLLPDIEGGLRLFDLAPRGAISFPVSADGFGTPDRRLAFGDAAYTRIHEGRAITAQRLADQPYQVSAVETESHGAMLQAWIFEPVNPQGVGVVLLHGAGESDRNNSWYVQVAHTLAADGITVILPDKRGSGRSEGDWRHEGFDVLTDDGVAWMRVLRRAAPGLDHYGVIGCSQGGFYAPDVAARADADFAAAWSTPATSLRAQLTTEIRNDARDSGLPGWLQRLLVPPFEARARGRYPEFWRLNGDRNMMTAWENWRGPFFMAFGSDDEFDNVPVLQSVAILEAHYSTFDALEWHVYPGLGHALSTSERVLDPDFLADFQSFIDRL